MAIKLELAKELFEKTIDTMGLDYEESSIVEDTYYMGLHLTVDRYDDADVFINMTVFPTGRLAFTAVFDCLELNEMSYALLNGFNERTTLLFAYVDTGIGCLTLSHDELSGSTEENIRDVAFTCLNEIISEELAPSLTPLVKLTHR